jgi:hypothetical protein
MRWITSGLGGSASLLSAILVAGWAAMVLILAAVMVLTGALCWVLADSKRPTRLAMLLKAWRSTTPPNAVRTQRRRR